MWFVLQGTNLSRSGWFQPLWQTATFLFAQTPFTSRAPCLSSSTKSLLFITRTAQRWAATRLGANTQRIQCQVCEKVLSELTLFASQSDVCVRLAVKGSNLCYSGAIRSGTAGGVEITVKSPRGESKPLWCHFWMLSKVKSVWLNIFINCLLLKIENTQLYLWNVARTGCYQTIGVRFPPWLFCRQTEDRSVLSAKRGLLNVSTVWCCSTSTCRACWIPSRRNPCCFSKLNASQ